VKNRNSVTFAPCSSQVQHVSFNGVAAQEVGETVGVKDFSRRRRCEQTAILPNLTTPGKAASTNTPTVSSGLVRQYRAIL
jgi:hypothetical protein